MLEYIQKLWNEPSKENLKMVEEEITRANEIINSYHLEIGNLLEKWRNPDDKEIKDNERKINDETVFINECRVVANKIAEALGLRK